MLPFALAKFFRSKNQEFALVRADTKAKGNLQRNVSREFLTSVHFILANSNNSSPRIPVNLMRSLISI